MHLCVADYRVGRTSRRGLAPARPCRQLTLNASPAAELVLELDQAPKASQFRHILIAIDGCQHARQIPGRRNRRTDASPKRLAIRGASKVIPPTRAGGRQHDPHVTERRRDHRRLLHVERGNISADLLERVREPTQILGPRRRDDVDVARRLPGAVNYSSESADDDEGHPVTLQSGKDAYGIERLIAPSCHFGLTLKSS